MQTCRVCSKVGHLWNDTRACQDLKNQKQHKFDFQSETSTVDGPRSKNHLLCCRSQPCLHLTSTQFLEYEAPTSAGRILNAIGLADALSLKPILESPTKQYFVGWGRAGANSKPVLYSWAFKINYIRNVPTAFTFNPIPGSSPLVIRLDQRRFANTINTQDPTLLVLKRTCDKREEGFLHTSRRPPRYWKALLRAHHSQQNHLMHTSCIKTRRISSCSKTKSFTGNHMPQQMKCQTYCTTHNLQTRKPTLFVQSYPIPAIFVHKMEDLLQRKMFCYACKGSIQSIAPSRFFGQYHTRRKILYPKHYLCWRCLRRASNCTK